MTDHDGESDGGHRLNRRRALSALGTGAGAVLGLGAFSGTAVAWEEFHACFRGCSEVWMVVQWHDVGRDPPLVAYVIVESNGEAVCRTVEFTEANATTIPGKFGDAAVVTYAPGGDDKVLGVVEHDYGELDGPAWCVTVNENNCADTPNTPDVWDGPCVSEEGQAVCPEGDYCGGTGGGRGPPQDRRNGHRGSQKRRGPPSRD
jgi:hypothetical protein